MDDYSTTSEVFFDESNGVCSNPGDELSFQVYFGGCFFIYPLDYVGEHVIELRLPKWKNVSFQEMNEILLEKTEGDIWKWFYCKPKCSLEEGLTLVENDKDMDTMFQQANLHSKVDVFIGQIPQLILVDYYFKILRCVYNDEEDAAMYKSHEKTKNDLNTKTFEEILAWEQEETQSPSYLRSPHVWKNKSSCDTMTMKGKELLCDFDDVADALLVETNGDANNTNGDS